MQDYQIHLQSDKFHEITNKLVGGESISREELIHLLGTRNCHELNHLYTLARTLREKHFGPKVFLYGFIYFSTHCQNNCSFCSFRIDNLSLKRYRKRIAEVLTVARKLKEENVHLIDLTMGEDPLYLIDAQNKCAKLCRMVSSTIQETGLPVMLSPGVLDRDTLHQLADQGLSWFACYQETHNTKHFKKLRLGQDFQKRIDAKSAARFAGLFIEEGILLGAGETREDIADSLLWMQRNRVDQARAMTYVPDPAEQTPQPAGQSVAEETVIAIMRLLMPDVLIPASLDIEGLAGLNSRLNSGANVVTSIVPSHSGLTGVANGDGNSPSLKRGVKEILPLLHECGLQVASQQDFYQWMSLRRKRVCPQTSILEDVV